MFERDTNGESRWEFLVWPDVSDLVGAQEAIRFGYWCAFTAAVATAVLFPLGVLGGTLVGLFVATVYALVGLGIWRKWRAVVVVGFLLFAANFAATLAAGLHFSGIVGIIKFRSIVDIFIFFGLLAAVRGTFAYRRLVRTQGASESQPE